MTAVPPELLAARERFLALVEAVRPELQLDWHEDQVGLIRDYRYVPYLVDELDVTLKTEPA